MQIRTCWRKTQAAPTFNSRYYNTALHQNAAALHPGDNHGIKAIEPQNKNLSYIGASSHASDTNKTGRKTHIVDPEEVIPLDQDKKDF